MTTPTTLDPAVDEAPVRLQHTVTVRSVAGRKTGTVDLDPEMFGIEPNVAVLHQVVTAQLAARRRGTQSTRTKAEVKGGAGKPWRQKGTGRARHGSNRNPQWRGGGVALGPKPRSYRQRTPKKMIRLALRSALSDRARDEKVVVVDRWKFTTPRTKEAMAALKALKVDGRVLVVAERDHQEVWKSFRNLPKVHLVSPGELNAYDVLVSDAVVFTLDTLPTGDTDDEATEPANSDTEAEGAEEVQAETTAEEENGQ
ncbi:50S ribosomal protein L4 [Candidatus Poriferisocius sp.]|uniref:50S ribosomal protein L4 n=1 Tax=Candidatus Poriferisocius sp. TaxID=3101276 RepID=UPI003B5B8D6B